MMQRPSWGVPGVCTRVNGFHCQRTGQAKGENVVTGGAPAWVPVGVGTQQAPQFFSPKTAAPLSLSVSK